MCILHSVKGLNTQLKGRDCRLVTQLLDLKNEDAFGKKIKRVKGRRWKDSLQRVRVAAGYRKCMLLHLNI